MPKINERSKFLDERKNGGERKYPRERRLEMMVDLYN